MGTLIENRRPRAGRASSSYVRSCGLKNDLARLTDFTKALKSPKIGAMRQLDYHSPAGGPLEHAGPQRMQAGFGAGRSQTHLLGK